MRAMLRSATHIRRQWRGSGPSSAAGGIARRGTAALELRGARLVSPGVIAVGVATAVLHSTGSEHAGTVLSVVVLGSILSDVAALSLSAPEPAA